MPPDVSLRRRTTGNSVTNKLTIGTRGSPLALAQAHDVKRRLLAAHDDLTEDTVAIHVMSTAGDRILDRHLMLAGGKGLFTKEIEDALLAGDIDLAVHSCKDVPTTLPDGLTLAAFLERENPHDVFLSADGSPFDALPNGATLGTASLRRRAQALRLRPDLKVVNFRGNVDTRLAKLKAGEAHGTFLARAGLNRLGKDIGGETLDAERFLPAPAQGIVTIEIREVDTATADRLNPLHHPASGTAALAERAFLQALDGSCRTPIAAHARVTGDRLTMTGQLLAVDGQQLFEETGDAPLVDAAALGRDLGLKERARAGETFFDQLKQDAERVVA